MMLIYIFNLDAQETSVFKTSKQPKKVGRRRRPTSSAVIPSFVQMLPGHPNSTCRLASYLMEHIYCEAQLCSEIATLKEKSNKNQKYAKNRWAGGAYKQPAWKPFILSRPEGSHGMIRRPRFGSQTPN